MQRPSAVTFSGMRCFLGFTRRATVSWCACDRPHWSSHTLACSWALMPQRRAWNEVNAVCHGANSSCTIKNGHFCSWLKKFVFNKTKMFINVCNKSSRLDSVLNQSVRCTQIIFWKIVLIRLKFSKSFSVESFLLAGPEHVSLQPYQAFSRRFWYQIKSSRICGGQSGIGKRPP